MYTDDIFKAVTKLGGFEIKFESAKHTKIVHIKTGKASVIPRHSPVNRNIVRDFVEDFLVRDLGFEEKEIYKHLWC